MKQDKLSVNIVNRNGVESPIEFMDRTYTNFKADKVFIYACSEDVKDIEKKPVDVWNVQTAKNYLKYLEVKYEE